MTLNKYRSKLERLKGKKQQIQQDLKEIETQLQNKTKEKKEYEKAREILKEVGMKTQQKLQYQISNVTSLALESVFPDPYNLVVEFVQRRNKTECDIYFERNGNEISNVGGGARDIASFALRVAAWSMQLDKSRNVLVLDEPFKNLSSSMQPQAGLMLTEISDKLGLQIIMVSHEEKIKNTADKAFKVFKEDNVSKAVELN